MEELRAQLLERHAALRRLGPLGRKATPTNWYTATTDRYCCRWIYGFAPTPPDVDDPTRFDTLESPFREGAEALALLNALARVDVDAFHDEVSCVWAPGSVARDITQRKQWAIGFVYQVRAPDDIVFLCARLTADEAPSASFVQDYNQLKTMPAQARDGSINAFEPRSIAVRIHVRMTSDRAADLAVVLLAIVRSLTTQRLVREPSKGHDKQDEQARISARFHVVEVDVGASTMTIVALECLVQLKQLGIRVPCLAAIRISGTAQLELCRVAKALHVLLPPAVASRTTACTTHVRVNELASSRFLPAVLSSIQASRDVKTVNVKLYWGTDDLEDLEDAPDAAASMTLWKWAAYALFSRHASTHVTKIVVDFTHLEDDMLDAAMDIVRARNPLATLFSSAATEPDQWICASYFHMQDPQIESASCHDKSVFATREPLSVRVIDVARSGDEKWCRVLLPGCGPAWVRMVDATAVTSSAGSVVSTATGTGRAMPPLHLQFEEVYQFSLYPMLALLRSLPREVANIEIETGVHEEDGFDVTEFTIDALIVCPELERLQFNCLAEIRRLSIFVEAAEMGHARLGSLSLKQTFYTDDTDIMEFLVVLSDRQHPLTRRLEELDLTVCVRDPTPVETFESAWRRMLERNHMLHTVSLTLLASHFTDDDGVDDYPGFYSRPMAMESMVAFLSTIHHLRSEHSARSRLDTGVVATIFEFGAQHRSVRILIEEA